MLMLIEPHDRELAPCLHHLLGSQATTTLLTLPSNINVFHLTFRKEFEVKFPVESML